jgi:hypothetical protein
MAPMIAAKNMAGKEAVDSSTPPACSSPVPYTMQKFVQTANVVGSVSIIIRQPIGACGPAPRAGGVSPIGISSRPRGASDIFLLGKGVQKLS